jgi:hypothetical protein
MTYARPAAPTVSFVDEYCQLYQDLFPDVRSFDRVSGHLPSYAYQEWDDLRSSRSHQKQESPMRQKQGLIWPKALLLGW